MFAGALAQGCGCDRSMSDAHGLIVRQLRFFSLCLFCFFPPPLLYSRQRNPHLHQRGDIFEKFPRGLIMCCLNSSELLILLGFVTNIS